ncbi:MAG: thioredoxin domain-containing protein [Anaerolineae bacterium]
MKHQYRLFALLAVLLLLLAACAAPGIENTTPAAGTDNTAANTGNAAADTATVAAGVNGDPRSKGSADAPITLVEYSDFQCPYCSRWVQDTYPAIIKDYIATGQVRLEFRDFPLTSIHPNAMNAAIASRCAAEQDSYWPMHDALFAKQGEWSAQADPAKTFSGYAGEIGLDTAAFDTCLTSGKYDSAIQADLQAGQAAGVTGTPSFLINNTLVVGAQPVSAFQQAFDTILAGGALADPNAAAATPAPQAAPSPVAINIEGAPVKGDPNAPMTIVEFSDFQCPFCARFFQETQPSLLKEYIETGKAKLVFKDFPLEAIHPNAEKAAEAAQCVRELAGGDDAFWAMHDKLFATQADWSGVADPSSIFSGYAVEIGAAKADFDSCLSTGKYKAQIQADLQQGLSIGVQGTPSFFLNGQIFVGAQPFTNFQQAIAMVQQGLNIVPTPAPTPAPEPTPSPLSQDVPLDNVGGMKGDPKAPVVIVEYSDYQCPYCLRHFAETLPQLQKFIDDGTVLYVFKDYPLSSIHPQAEKAAEAARCAGAQDAYWEMHDKLFGQQQEWSGQATAVDVFKRFAGDLKLDQAKFDQCLDSGSQAAAIQANLQEGAGFGIQGTPGFFVNRQPLPGAYPFEFFQQLIQSELNQ